MTFAISGEYLKPQHSSFTPKITVGYRFSWGSGTLIGFLSEPFVPQWIGRSTHWPRPVLETYFITPQLLEIEGR